jgi:hypothetical protein
MKLSRRNFLKRGSTALAAAGGTAALGADENPVSPPVVKRDESSKTASIFAYGYHKEPYPLPTGPQLFLDWRYVQCGRVAWQTADGSDAPLFAQREITGVRGKPRAVPFGIRLAPQTAERVGPVIPNDRDWEFMIGGYISLHALDGKFGLWYEVVPPGGGGSANLLCYAESKDGLHWSKPELGLVEFRGSRQNNIVIDGQQCPYKSFHGNSVFLDPTAPPATRFKVIYMAMSKDPGLVERVKRERPWSVSELGERKRTLILLGSSPDGLRWEFSRDILMVHQSDTQTTVYYDAFLKRYVGYFRTVVMNRRAIGRSETAEIRRWPVPETVLWSQAQEDPTEDYYDNSKSLYPGTSTMHLMFPTIYRRRNDDCSLRIASSLDGALWQTIPGDVLQCGPPESWDAGCLFGGYGLTEIPDGRVVLPYAGFRLPHKYPRFGRMGQVGFAAWKQERLVALEAAEEGEFHTQSLLVSGNRLLLNFQAKPAGHIKVEVADVAGRSLADCDPLVGDQHKAVVTWRGQSSLGVQSNRDLVLRFQLRAAKLFSFEIK